MPFNEPPIQNQVLLTNGIAQNVWVKWFGIISKAATLIRNDGSLEMPSIADADAVNNSIYFSTTQSKLVYKDSGGVVNDLY
jgi:hypothetical protein